MQDLHSVNVTVQGKCQIVTKYKFQNQNIALIHDSNIMLRILRWVLRGAQLAIMYLQLKVGAPLTAAADFQILQTDIKMSETC